MQDILDFSPTRSILNNTQRAKIARALLLALVIMGFVQLISDCAEYNMLEKYKDGTITYGDQKWNGIRQIIITIIRFALTITCIVFFIMWFRRAFHNLHKLGVEGLSASEGWAAGAWFVPIFNLYRPYQLMRETWERTIETAGKVEDVRYEKISGMIVGFWWLFWTLRVVIGIIVSSMPNTSYDIDILQTRDVVKVFYAICEMSAGLFAMVMVKRLSYFESMLFTHQEEIIRQHKLQEELEEPIEISEEVTEEQEESEGDRPE